MSPHVVPFLHTLSSPAFFQLISHRPRLASWTVLLLHLWCTLHLPLPTVRPCASTTSHPHSSPKDLPSLVTTVDVHFISRPTSHYLCSLAVPGLSLTISWPGCTPLGKLLPHWGMFFPKLNLLINIQSPDTIPLLHGIPRSPLLPITWGLVPENSSWIIPACSTSSKKLSSHSGLQDALPSNPYSPVRAGTGHKTWRTCNTGSGCAHKDTSATSRSFFALFIFSGPARATH